MRSTSFLTFFLLAFLSILQLCLAEPTPVDDLSERDTGLDIAPMSGESFQLTTGGGSGLSNFKSEKLVCPTGWGTCRNNPGYCCRVGGWCCGNKKCCNPGSWCYGGGCCPNNRNGCDGK
ncbi:hypothetical protein FRC12_009853, partial [Ceratobasidium sp. 428]